MITYSESDINRQLAHSAHVGTSFVPDKRVDGVIQEYLAEMKAMAEEFVRYVTVENEADLKADLEAYRQGYLKGLNIYLAARSRCMSTMITGPSNFPTSRNQERNETADKRRQEWLLWCSRTKERLRKTYNPHLLANAPISSDDQDAITKLQAKIEHAEKLQTMMKAANAIVRKKLTDEAKITELVKLEGISEQTARDLLQPDFAGGLGFAHYQLTNNNANIRRMKERIRQLEKERGREVGSDQVINGVTVSENKDLNRLQLFFDGKPAEDIRTKLKAHGFKWSPTQGAWQRQLNEAARWAARQVLSG